MPMKMGIHQTLDGHCIEPFWIPAFAGMIVRWRVLTLMVTAISRFFDPI